MAPMLKTIKINKNTNINSFNIITRTIDNDNSRVYINRYKKNIDSLIFSSFHLLDNSTHTDKSYCKNYVYNILDGGHRIEALYEYAVENNTEFLIRVWLYDWKEFDYNLDKVAKFVEVINTSNKFSKLNVLETNEFQSNWAAYFNNETKIKINYKQGSSQLSWTNVLNAFLNTNKMLQDKKILRVRGYDINDMRKEFLEGELKGIKRFHQYLKWWIPIAQKAKDDYKINILYSVPFLTTGFLIWSENPHIRPEDGQKLVDFKRFMKLAKFSQAAHFPELLKFTLFAINYRNSVKRYSVFEELGEEINIL